jgi:Septum formation
MAAPAGVSSGSAPEPPAPEPTGSDAEESAAAVLDPEQEPTAPEPAALEPVASDPVASDPGEPAGATRGAGRLVAAVVVIAVIAAAAAAGVLFVVTHHFQRKTIVTYRPAAVYSLRAGDCINSSPNGLSVTILSCATPHQAEVFATFRLAGSSWPGSTAVQQRANSGCADRIASYLNPQLLDAGLIQEYVYPNHDAWQAGVRTVICEVSSSTGPLSGSVRQSG